MAKAHLCIGGPLDGEFATISDFTVYYEKIPGTNRNDYSKRTQGMYSHLWKDYFQFNTANHGYAPTDVVWLHKSILKKSISPKNR